MASSIMIESCDLGETLADEEEALVTCKRLTGKMNERIATLLVSNMRCTTLVNREDPSEAQGDNKIIPAITDLNISSAMSSRMKKLIKAIREAAKVSWDLKRRGTVEDEDAPLPSESKRLGSLLFRRYKPRSSANADAGETVVSRSKRQLNKHCIKTENILKTKTSIMQASGGSGAPRRQRSMSIALPNEDEDTDTHSCQITGCFEA